MIKYTFLLSFLLLLIACQKESITNVGNRQNNTPTLLQKVVITDHVGNSHTYTYKYDNQNRLTTSIGYSNLYSWKGVITVEYDALNHIKKSTYYQTDSNNVPSFYHNSYTFEYSNNRMVKSNYVALSPTTNSGENHAYAYDSIGRLIADTSLPTVPNYSKRYTIFQYDNNNNVVKRREYFQNTSGIGYSFLYEYNSTYDTHPNSYINIGVNYFPVFNDRYQMSSNNLTREYRAGDSPQVFTHTYDNDGRLIKSQSYPETHPQFTSTFEYYYQ